MTILGTTYKVDKCCMMIGTVQVESGTVPLFGLLYDIVIYGREPQVLFVFILMETIQYNPIFGAYELISQAKYICRYRSAIHCYHPFNPVSTLDSTKVFVRSKYDLTVYCNYMS